MLGSSESSLSFQVDEPQLEEGATTIMLRSLPSSTTPASLMRMLGSSFVGSYDFLYLPRCSRQRHRIVEMAFINFVDHAFARLAVQLFREAAAIPSWSRTRVSQARIQGLGPNLAYFILRFGEAAIHEPDAPAVFVNGMHASLQDQCNLHINTDAIRHARLILQEETQPRSRQGQREQGREQGQRERPARFNVSNPIDTEEGVETILVDPFTAHDLQRLLELVRLHEERFGCAIFRL
eukprot:symbB.v1.2.029074.t1/scaffold3147.1/size62449/2